ncbi:MAG TPA: flagellar hook capping FlgD N-terminal domain-containing protein [Sphingobium sp.]|nr:flagellar hook capping FlgD N-terminal domain-containing protein [Sphingobium sp.]
MTVNTDIYTQAGLNGPQTAGAKETGVQTIDQAGFLKLMTAQLQYQDPFSPMDNNQMVQQMATFTQLETQAQGNKYLQSIQDSLTGTRLSDAASWIGKAMLVASDIATPDRAGSYAGEITLAEDADAVAIDLVDMNGNTVRTLDLGPQKAGAIGFYWDGMDDAGEMIGGGPLQVKLRGGTSKQIATWASIAAVQSPASGTDARLITPLGNFSPSDALRLG